MRALELQEPAAEAIWLMFVLTSGAQLLHDQGCTCRGRLTALQSELTKQENQAKQQSAARLQSMTAEAARMEAAALEEGEARCATVQVCCLRQTMYKPNPSPGGLSRSI